MTAKEFLKDKGIKISDISHRSGIPYTTVSEIFNGKIDADRIQIGTAMKIADVCGVSFEELYHLLKNSALAYCEDGSGVFVKNKSYYYRYSENGTVREKRLCKVNQVNSRFIKDMALWEKEKTERAAEKIRKSEEVEKWTPDTI